MKREELLTYNDEALVTWYQEEVDATALDILFKRYKSSVFGLAFYYLKSKDSAMDMVMDVFEIVIRAIRKTEVSSFKYWVLSITRNQCLKRLRDTMKVVELVNDDDLAMENTTSKVYSDKEIDQLLTSLRTLKPLQQDCVRSFYLNGMSYRQIAEVYQINEKQVKSHIQNGKRNLRIVLKRSKTAHG